MAKKRPTKPAKAKQLELPSAGKPGKIPVAPPPAILAKSLTVVALEDEMKSSYIDYAMSVIVGRALPDVRDGLKPVQRRILYGMYDMGLTHDKPTRKCAKIVGEVMGNYHPHGNEIGR